MTNLRQLATREAVRALLQGLGVDLTDPNFVDTPDRVTRWLLDKFLASEVVAAGLKEVQEKRFPTTYEGMVTQSGIGVWGLCPHHLLPVQYDVTVSYIPKGWSIGLSKLTRTSRIILSQAGLQEDLTARLAQELQVILGVEDVAVVVRGRHYCMISRGVEAHSSVTTTSTVLGRYRTVAEARHEFLALAKEK